MKLKVMACYDSKAGCYSTPFYTQTVNVALRAFADAANIPDHAMNKHPEDYTLFLLGEFDDETGIHTPCEPKLLQNATNYKKEPSNVRQIAS